MAIPVNLQIIGGLSLGKKLRETTMVSTPTNPVMTLDDIKKLDLADVIEISWDLNIA